MAQITVKAASGIRVPKDGAPREYITDEDAVTVPRSAYYLRRIADGDLCLDQPDAQEEAMKPAPDVKSDTPDAPAAAAGEATALPVKSRKTSQENAS